eukprot:Tamp_11728.p1 GENE.Tamp_11728~~Tamp_11728.p1  ORF type:complete len:471 (+),score=45.15 Tamp_11728:63-1415(+)
MSAGDQRSFDGIYSPVTPSSSGTSSNNPLKRRDSCIILSSNLQHDSATAAAPPGLLRHLSMSQNIAEGSRTEPGQRKGESEMEEGGEHSSHSHSLSPAHNPVAHDSTSTSSNAVLTWQLGPCLGTGAFASVYQAIDTGTGKFIAVKKIALRGQSRDAVKTLQREIRLMCRLPDNPHIVRYLGSESQDDCSRLYIFLEFVSGGSISDMLSKFGALHERIVRKYTHQMLLGLVFLHSHNVVHCDIKGGNILVSEDGIIKLADFNSSKSNTASAWSGDAPRQSIAGTPQFMAPEVIRQVGYGPKADIWSVACTVIQMLTAEAPWNELSNSQAIFRAVGTREGAPTYPPDISEECRKFMDACFETAPEARPAAADLVAHAFCSQVATGATFSPGEDGVCAICSTAIEKHNPEDKSCYVFVEGQDGTCDKCRYALCSHIGLCKFCPVWVSSSTTY